MSRHTFRTRTGLDVPAVTAAEMRDVDRVAVEDVGLQLLQLMENAGRALAWHVRAVDPERVLVLAGSGGNGGGGLACARHLANRGVAVRVVLDRPPAELTGAAGRQHRILAEMSVPIAAAPDSLPQPAERTAVVDALIGYGLDGEVREPTRRYVAAVNRRSGPTVSLDVPSGLDATTGEAHGVAIAPDRTVTLALPKTGLDAGSAPTYLADIGIPDTVYERLGIEYDRPFDDRDWVRLE